jgi:cytochrome c553
MMKTSFKLLVIGASLAISSQTIAAGDPVAGRNKAETCLGCHAVASYFNVYPSYHVPKLAGQHADYLITALQAYKAGTRKHETMQANAANLSDQDMADIAAYLSNAK